MPPITTVARGRCKTKCCGPKGAGPGCTRCGSRGHCAECADTYYTLSPKEKCLPAPQPDGGLCDAAGDRGCASRACRGGRCCSAGAVAPGCTGCDEHGDCTRCAAGFALVDVTAPAESTSGSGSGEFVTCEPDSPGLDREADRGAAEAAGAAGAAGRGAGEL